MKVKNVKANSLQLVKSLYKNNRGDNASAVISLVVGLVIVILTMETETVIRFAGYMFIFLFASIATTDVFIIAKRSFEFDLPYVLWGVVLTVIHLLIALTISNIEFHLYMLMSGIVIAGGMLYKLEH